MLYTNSFLRKISAISIFSSISFRYAEHFLPRINSFLILRKKHDEVVDNLDQMRKLWMRLDEETGMKERRKIWEDYLEMKAQRKKNLENARKKNALTKQKKQAKVEGDSVIEGSEREGSVSVFGRAEEMGMTRDSSPSIL